jgi:hypothetical protein
MRTKLGIVLAVIAVVFATTVFAANVHLKPPNSEPVFTDGGLFLEGTASLAGLGNEDLLITLTAQANVTATCTNQGGNAAPGQNPAPITVSGSQAIPASQIKNGNLMFDVFTVAPVALIPGAPDCANPNWTEQILDLSFTSAILTVEQPIGTVVFVLACTTTPTLNGLISRDDVVCVVATP